MSNAGRRNVVVAVIVLGAIFALAGGALLYSSRRGTPKRAASRTPPYWQRTGFLSKFLQDLNAGGPKGLASIQVPEGFEVSVAAGQDLVNYPMFIAFDDRGRLFICESAGKNISDEDMNQKPEMRIRMLEDTNGDGVFDRSKIDRKSTRLNSSHIQKSRMPSSA